MIDEIRGTVYGLLESAYSNNDLVIVTKDAAAIAEGIALCRGHAPGDDLQQAKEHIRRSLTNLFSFDPIQGGYFLYRKFSAKSAILYPESRYFSLETCIEFSVAAGMDYDTFQEFATKLMGFRWLYLRSPEYMAGDYCIKFGLAPRQYHELVVFVNQSADSCREFQTSATAYFKQEYDTFIEGTALRGKLETEEYVKRFKKFAAPRIAFVKGNFSRTIQDIRQLILHPYESTWLAEHLNPDDNGFVGKFTNALIPTIMPWEFKYSSAAVKEAEERIDPSVIAAEPEQSEDVIRRIFQLEVSDFAVSRHVRIYNLSTSKRGRAKAAQNNAAASPAIQERKLRSDAGRTASSENIKFEDMNLRRVRNDLVRVLMMNDFDQQYIDEELIMHSLDALSLEDPFDYLVISAIRIFKLPIEQKPEEFLNQRPYEILTNLVGYMGS